MVDSYIYIYNYIRSEVFHKLSSMLNDLMISEDVGLVVEHRRLSSQQPRSPNTKAYRCRNYIEPHDTQSADWFKTVQNQDPDVGRRRSQRQSNLWTPSLFYLVLNETPEAKSCEVHYQLYIYISLPVAIAWILHHNQKAALLLSHCLPVHIESSAKSSTSSSRAQAPEWRPTLRIVHTETNPPTAVMYHDVFMYPRNRMT